MDKDTLINSILIEWSSRSPTGLCYETYSEESLEILREVIEEVFGNSINSFEFVNEISIIAEKGRHPERQAYNKNGILVTFPTPEYKARAIARGTHFEKNPKAAQSNVFGGGQSAPQAPSPTPTATTPSTDSMDTGASALPKSDTGTPQAPPAKKEVPEPGTPGGSVPPAPAPSAASAPPTQPPAQGQLAVEPIPQQPTTPPVVAPVPPPVSPPAPKKTPKQIAAEKEVVKQMLNTDDTLPTVPGVGGSGMAENLKEELVKLTKVALEMKYNEAVKFLSQHL